MVATGSPEATKAAVEILEMGGNAIDAAVAAALTLGVVDAQSSGIGGSTNILIYLAYGRTLAVDGTSRSPMAIDIEKFRKFKESGRTYGYETISVPTTPASLEYVRERYGTMKMVTLEQMGFKRMTVLRYPPPDAPDDTSVDKFGGVNAVLYDPATGVFSGVGDPRRSGFALGPRAVADPQERP